MRDRKKRAALTDDLPEIGNHTAARANDVAITDYGKSRPILSGQIIGGDEYLIGRKLAGAIQIDRAHGLVGRQGDDPLHLLPQRSPDDVLGAMNIRVDAFERVVLGDADMLQGGGMDDIVDPGHRHLKTLGIAHVPDEIAEFGIGIRRELMRHVELLLFVARKNDKAAHLVFLQDGPDELLPEAASSSRYKNGFAVEIDLALGE